MSERRPTVVRAWLLAVGASALIVLVCWSFAWAAAHLGAGG